MSTVCPRVSRAQTYLFVWASISKRNLAAGLKLIPTRSPQELSILSFCESNHAHACTRKVENSNGLVGPLQNILLITRLQPHWFKPTALFWLAGGESWKLVLSPPASAHQEGGNFQG